MQEFNSDFIRPVPDEPEKPKKRRRRWLIFLGIFLVVLAGLFWYLSSQTTLLDGVVRSLRYMGKNGSEKITFETYGTTAYALVGDDLAVASRSGVTLFSDSGETIGHQQAELSAPALLGGQDAVLIYDVGGSFYGVMDTNGKMRFQGASSGRIYDADLTEAGGAAVLSSASDARAVVEVFDKNGTLLYRRTSKTSYLNACALSPDGGWLAVATLGQEDISFAPGAKLYRTNAEEEQASLSFGGQTIFDLKFLGNGTACAVGSRSISFFDTAGSLLGEYSLESTDLLGYAFGDGFVTVMVDRHEAGSRYQLLTLSTDGTVRASSTLQETPVHLSVAGEYLSVLTAQGLHIYDSALAQKSSREGNWTKAFVRRDGTAILVAVDEAEVYIP